MDDMGRHSDDELHNQFLDIVDKITGNNALSDYDGAYYTLLPELFTEFLTNQDKVHAFNTLKGKLDEISKLLLEFSDNIERNHIRTKFEKQNKKFF